MGGRGHPRLEAGGAPPFPLQYPSVTPPTLFLSLQLQPWLQRCCNRRLLLPNHRPNLLQPVLRAVATLSFKGRPLVVGGWPYCSTRGTHSPYVQEPWSKMGAEHPGFFFETFWASTQQGPKKQTCYWHCWGTATPEGCSGGRGAIAPSNHNQAVP